MANTILPTPPQGLPVVDPTSGRMAAQWWDFFNSLSQALRAGMTDTVSPVTSLTVVNGIVTEAS